MNKLERSKRRQMFCTALLMSLLAACSGSQDAILGIGGIAVRAPTVTAVTPAPNATGVSIGNPGITATFSEPMAPITGAASFTVTCVAPCTNPTGTVALDASNRVATFTLTAGTTLQALIGYTATVTAAQSQATGLLLESPTVWSFTTGAAPDTTRPRVLVTEPATTNPSPTTGVPTNTPITAVFSEDMAPASIRAASFTLTCVAPCTAPNGTVSYAVSSRTAVFSPATLLAAGQTYTVTITTTATDLAGNALAGNQAALPAASNYVWTFTTAAPPPSDTTRPRVLGTQPATTSPGQTTGVPIITPITATFSEDMDPATIRAASFTLTCIAPCSAPSGIVSYAVDTRTAVFSPATVLAAAQTYTVTITTTATDLAGNALAGNPAAPLAASNYVWTFTTEAVALKSAATFGGLGGPAGMTNMGTLTVINGDIGTTAASTTMTGFHDAGFGCIYTETGANIGTVNGVIFTDGPPPTVDCPSEGTPATFAKAQQAQMDAQIAFDDLAGRPGNPIAADLGGLTLAPGVYSAAANSFRIQDSDLTLDAGGNANAVWIFQMATTLTVGGADDTAPQSVILINGAQAKNVFWQVGSAATINAAGGGTMVGTIIARAGAAFSTAGNADVVILNGRVLSLNASVTLVNTVINVPAP